MAKTEFALLCAVKDLREEGVDVANELDILERANTIPVEPPKLRNIGNKVLELFGRETRPYTMNHWTRYKVALAHLELTGRLHSDNEATPRKQGGPTRRDYWLPSPETDVAA